MIGGVLALVGLVAGTLLIPTGAAYAATGAGVPPEALDNCERAPQDWGGWLVRDVVSSGTSATDPTPVRPRNARFQEPCFDTEGFGDAPLNIPIDLSDVPTEGTAEEPPPAGTSGFYPDITSSCGPEYTGGQWRTFGSCARKIEMSTEFVGTPHATYGSTQSLTVRWTLEAASAFDGAVQGRTYCYIIGQNPNLATSYVSSSTWTLVSSNGNLGAGWTRIEGPQSPWLSGTAEQTFNCAPGQLVAWVRDINGTTLPTGPERGWFAPMIPGGPSWEGITPGTGYFGGTQAAQFVFGASTEYSGVTSNGFVTCSTDYAGTNTTTHSIDAKGLDDWDNADRSEIPPITDEEGNATAWDARVNYYPTDVSSGGVYESNCAFLINITVWVCAYSANDPTQYGCMEQTWDSERYRVQDPYDGGDGGNPLETLCNVYPETPGCYAILNPDSLEGVIECTIEAEGEFFAWIISWIGNLPGWIGCMVTPEGWDRSDRIGRAWDRGNLNLLSDTYTAAVPDGLTCGDIGGLVFFDTVVTVDTCGADFAPTWIKTAIGWLIILGLAVLAIRRIMWAVGGEKS